MAQHQIAIITCWYGSYPWYFPYFIHSCKFNSTIDFIIITDNDDEISNKSENVKIINKSLEEIRLIATEKMAFAANIYYPYKLCDFKPTYGFLFPEIIEGYEFWGHGDIDVVYGNIRAFITDELLNNFDIISCRHDYITGTFCLFKNNKLINNLFMLSKDFKKVFSSPYHFCFDECNFLWKQLERGASIFDFPDNIESMTWVVKKAEAQGKLKAFFDFIIIEGTPGEIKWDKGKVIYKDTYEAMFYHLIKFKTECKRPKVLSPMPDQFYFTAKKIMISQTS